MTLTDKLADALKPFAAMADDIPTNRMSIGNLHESDILKAAAVLSEYVAQLPSSERFFQLEKEQDKHL